MCYDNSARVPKGQKQEILKKLAGRRASRQDTQGLFDLEKTFAIYDGGQFDSVQQMDVLDLMQAVKNLSHSVSSESLASLKTLNEGKRKELNAYLDYIESGRYLNIIFTTALGLTGLVVFFLLKCCFGSEKRDYGQMEEEIERDENLMISEENKLKSKRENLQKRLGILPEKKDLKEELDEIDLNLKERK